MNIRRASICILTAVILTPLQIHAESLIEGSAEAGKAKSLTCSACHGQDGNSVNPLWPNIAGQSATYIVAQLKAFKTGTRSDPLMTGQAMLLSDDDLGDLAVYFEGLPPRYIAWARAIVPGLATANAGAGSPSK